MAIRYNKLFHLMIDKNMSNARLKEKAGFSANIITRLKRNEYVSMESIEQICRVLECKVDDILEFVPEEKESAPESADKNAEEGRRRRPAQEVTTDKTLRVAPIEDRPEFVPQGKVDDSQTRIFGKLTPESAKPEETPKNNAEQKTIRLTGEDVQAIREQTRKDTFTGHGKKRGEIKPMKKKKGLFGLGKKDTDDDFFIDPDAQNDDDDDDLFE